MSSREQIIEKIKKLQAHSVENGATEAEAVAFALKAQKLIAENDVEEWELGNEVDSREVVEIETQKGYARAWRGILGLAVADNFRCRVFMSRYREPGKRSKVRMTFVGYRCDAEAASLVFDHLYKTGDKLGKAHANRFYTNADAYECFVRGFVEGVECELEKQCQALMLVRPKEVDEYTDGLNLRQGRAPRAVSHNQQSRNLGKEAGRDAVRSRRMEAGKAGRLLTA